MTQGLRRELRKKFEIVIVDSGATSSEGVKSDFWQDVIGKLADAAKEVRAFQPQTIEQAIYMDVPVTQELADVANLRDKAPKMFEKALGFSKALPWWDGDKEWKALGEWVCERYAESKTSFGEYNIWRNTKYTKGGIANTRLRGFPAEFYDSWDMFMMSGEHKTDEERAEYQPYKPNDEEMTFVPRPK